MNVEKNQPPFYAPIGAGLGDDSSEQEIQTLLSGNIAFERIQEGLRVHYGDFTELKARTVESELLAGLSFNLMFKGQATFSLADKYYQIGSQAEEIEYSLFALNHAEKFKRLLRPGMNIKKLNIFVEKEWFDLRSHSAKQKEQINQLFSQHGIVRSFKAPKPMLDIARNLMQIGTQHSLGSDMLMEASVLQMLSLLVESNAVGVQSQCSLDQQVSQLIWEEAKGNTLSLQEIADHVGLSISTLQRRFKQQLGMTVIEFTRFERLEKAKHALVVDQLTIGEAAYLAGYQHTSNFISAFSKQYDVSPGQYVKDQLSVSGSRVAA